MCCVFPVSLSGDVVGGGVIMSGVLGFALDSEVVVHSIGIGGA